jgi:glycosyltransferase involved in cell wall biosynthesis
MSNSNSNKKKLLIFRPTLGQGGADRNTVILLRGLDRTLFDVSLVLMRKEGEFVDDVPADVAVHDLRAARLFTAWWPLFRLVASERPDILMSTSSGANLAAAVAHLLNGARGRLVLSERNTVAHGEQTMKRRVQTTLKRALYRSADSITVISEGLKNDVIRTLGVSAERLRVVYNPVVDDVLTRAATAPVEHPWFADDERARVPVVLACGRLVPQKDYPTLLRAFRKVRDGRAARLFILGDGPLRTDVEALVRELKLEADVHFAGFDKNPFKYMSRCAVFALSSVHEGLGSVLIQAMACGAPVVSTDCPYGPNEIIAAPGQDGELVAVGDVNALAARIAALLDDPIKRRAMGARAQESAQRFSAPAITQRYTAAILGWAA